MVKLPTLTIKSKLTALILAVSLGSIAVIGFLAWSKARAALKQEIFEHLTSVRASKGYQIESYFKTLSNHLETLGEDRMVVAAMVEFNKGFRKLNQQYIPNDWSEALRKYYEEEFFPRLAKNIEGQPNFQTYTPGGQAAEYLQYNYIAKNFNPAGKKDELAGAIDGSEYSKYHIRYHLLFQNLIKKFGYADLYLIDMKTGDIVYTVCKKTDFATNLNDGPYRESNLAQAVERVRKNSERGTVQLVDFTAYRPSYGLPAAFMAVPIYNGPHAVGILAVQLPVDQIDSVLTGNKNWKKEGLGQSGETFLVGEDLLMRSVSRLLIENAEGYKKALRSTGMPESTAQAIERQETSILLQKVDTEAARDALSGKEGTKIVGGYRGAPVLSSYSLLNISGVKWAILSEMDLGEAYQPVSALQNYLLIATVILILLMTYIASTAASRFIIPVEKIMKSARQVGAGNLDAEVRLDSGDEFGELARTFNEMLQLLRQQNESIEQKNRENQALLLNILPGAVAERVKQGEGQIADSVPQVMVLFADALGFTEVAASREVRETAEILNEIFNLFDEEARRYDVERLKTVGERYIGVCGLTKPHLDRTKRTLDFALALLEIAQQCNNKYGIKLSMRIGVHTGEVMAGIVGTHKFMYSIWGETVAIARHLNAHADPHTILVTQEVYDRAHELYSFERGKEIDFETKGKLTTWALRQKGLKGVVAEPSTGESDELDVFQAKSSDGRSAGGGSEVEIGPQTLSAGEQDKRKATDSKSEPV